MRKTERIITFIDTAVNAAKAISDRRTEYRLRSNKGELMDRLVLEVQPSAAQQKKAKRVWRVHCDWREGGNRVRRKVKIGDGHTSLALVRERWKEIKDAVDGGRDWVTEQEASRKRAEQERRGAFTFANLAEAYMTQHSKEKKRTWRDDERKLQTRILPVIGDKPVKAVTKSDLSPRRGWS